MLVFAKSLFDNQLVEFQIDTNSAKISSIQPCEQPAHSGERITSKQPELFFAPGLIDLQVNGNCGLDFSAPLSIEETESLVTSFDPHGVTQLFATVTTNSFDRITQSLAAISTAIGSSRKVANRIAGIHLEGPYISSESGPRGAHPGLHCKPPSLEEFDAFQKAAQGHIRLVTLSPEYAASTDFIRALTQNSVKVAIGHTNAEPSQIQAAVAAGATLSTHLGNGAHANIRRHPNYIWEQLSQDELFASIICDGHHLPVSVIKSFVRTKPKGKTFLVSDITSMAGRAPGVYPASPLGDVEVLEDGKLVVAGQSEYLAGASRHLLECVQRMATVDQCGLAEAVRMASVYPAQFANLNQNQTAARTNHEKLRNLFFFQSDSICDDSIRIQMVATANDREIVWQSGNFQSDAWKTKVRKTDAGDH